MSKILVVDDDSDHADSLALLFETMGHLVRIARHGSEAIEMARTFLPHIVFLDLEMPTMNGFEAAACIRFDPAAGHPFIVALSGMVGSDVQRRVQAAGFDTYLSKPADTNSLLALVASLSSRAQSRDAEPEAELALHRRSQDMNAIANLRQLVADTTSRCIELERALGAMLGLGGNEQAADEALQASRRLLALYTDRLARTEARATLHDLPNPRPGNV